MLIKRISRWYENKKIRKMCNYERIRNEKIEGNEIIANSSMFFYYDETGNIRKMSIDLKKEFGYNVNPNSPAFMVGGLWGGMKLRMRWLKS